MKKLLRSRDILLLGVANVIDIFEEIQNPLGLVSNAYKNFYGWVPERYKKHDFNHLVWRSLKTGYIEKVIKNDLPYYRLTSEGQKKIQRDFPLMTMQKRVWDKKWRMVLFDIEETNKRIRERLRNKLRELGFGMLQKSVFISPYNVAQDFVEFVESLDLSEFIYVIQSSDILSGNVKSLAGKVWKLDKLNDEYKEIIKKIEENALITISDRHKKINTKINVQEKIKMIREVRQKYLELIMKDPLLPKELLPGNWTGEKVRDLIKKLSKAEK